MRLRENMIKKTVEIGFHKKQYYLFHEVEARFKVIVKGRRFGLTRGMMQYAIKRALTGVGEKIFWVDTTYANIQRYIERYAMPILKQLPKGMYEWNKTKSEIKIYTKETAIIDFRSADRPENFEGFGYDLVILNEAGIILRNQNLWLESIRPMMLDYKADAIIGGTPKGKKYKGKEHLFYTLSKKAGDIPTDLFPSAVDSNKNWATLNFSSYDNEMLDKEDIDELASEISPALRDQEIYGLFVDVETDRIIKREWFDAMTNLTKLQGKFILQSWDTAFKKNEENDYSVCTTWAESNNRYWLIDIFRERLEFPELKRKVVELDEKFKPNEIIIEDKASGISLIQELDSSTTLPLKPIKVGNIDKVTRVHSITPIIEAGKVILYAQMDNVNELLNESEEFPNGEYDDMVDSMSQALEYLRNRPTIIPPKPKTRKYRKKKIY